MAINESIVVDPTISWNLLNPPTTTFLIAVIIFFIGFIIGRIAQKLILKLLDMMELDKIIAKNLGFRYSISRMFSGMIAYIIYFSAIIAGLSELGIASQFIIVVVTLLILLILLFTIFGLNDAFANFFSGFILRYKLKEGDRIQLKNIHGKIRRMNLLNIQLESKGHEHTFIPNMMLFKNKYKKINKSKNINN